MHINSLHKSKINLVETLDRALNKGIVIAGDVTISVANVDLVYIQLRLLISSVETAMQMKNGTFHQNVEEVQYD